MTSLILSIDTVGVSKRLGSLIDLLKVGYQVVAPGAAASLWIVTYGKIISRIM